MVLSNQDATTSIGTRYLYMSTVNIVMVKVCNSLDYVFVYINSEQTWSFR